MKKLKIGIIGCGGIANEKHMPSLAKCSDMCEMVAFCDIIEERAVKAAKEYGTEDAKIYTDHQELLKDPEIDVVHVLTPNVSHCEITVHAFEAGKHVMCEKPMAANSADAQKMIDAWKASGKMFTIGYQNRFRGEIQHVKKACEAGDLGEIYYARAHAMRRRGVPTWGVFTNKALQGGGPLIDIGTHALDMTLWLMDNYEPDRVLGSVYHKLGNLPDAAACNDGGPWDPETFDVEDSAMGFIKMKNGATILLESSWAINLTDCREACTTLCGTKAGADILSGDSYPISKLVYNRGIYGKKMTEETLIEEEDTYYEGEMLNPCVIEAKQWIRAILEGTEPLVKPEQAFVVTQILEAIYRSSETGKEVVFD